MGKINANDIVDIVVNVLITSYGNLGYASFRIHSIKPNGKKDRYIARYSFIPRDGESKRIYHEARVDIKDKKLVEFEEIEETNLQKYLLSC